MKNILGALVCGMGILLPGQISANDDAGFLEKLVDGIKIVSAEMAGVQAVPEHEKTIMEHFAKVSKIKYVSDKKAYGKSDYWQCPE